MGMVAQDVLARRVKVPPPPLLLPVLELLLVSAGEFCELVERHLSKDRCCLARLKVERNCELR